MAVKRESSLTREQRQDLVRVARGELAADVSIRNARVVDVHTLTVYRASVAVKHGFVALVGVDTDAVEIVDASGGFLAPGLIDAHIHIESSLMTPRRFAGVVVPRGTVGVVAEPHELVNVTGLSGLHWMLEAGRNTPLHVWASVPSCVPASRFEASNATVTAADLDEALRAEGVLGLAEMMNYPGVLNLDSAVWDILEAARGGRMDGHAAGLRGREYQAYVNAGLESDHEAVTETEAFERLRAGSWLMVRDGSAARNLEAIAPLLTRLKPPRAMLVTDDADAGELLERGHMDRLLREAVRLGVPAAYAMRAMTLAPAEYWCLEARGAVAPGCIADLVLFDDLEHFDVRWTMIAGRVVARDGELLEPSVQTPPIGLRSVRLPDDWDASRLAVRLSRRRPVIGVRSGQIYTDALEPKRLLEADPSRDLAKIAVVERHKGTGRTGVGFSSGLGLKRGAMAQTVAHDHHNIIVAGVNDSDMAVAVRVLAHLGGGAVVVDDGEVKATLELPIAGLMSDASATEIVAAQREFEAAARDIGCTLSNPVLTLSFLALTVIPSLKITDQGLFDVHRWTLLETPASESEPVEVEHAGLLEGVDRKLDPLKSPLPDGVKDASPASSRSDEVKRLLN
jgi:adenine deaminase